MKEGIVGKVFSTNKSGDCVVTKYVRHNEVHIKFLDTVEPKVFEVLLEDKWSE